MWIINPQAETRQGLGQQADDLVARIVDEDQQAASRFRGRQDCWHGFRSWRTKFCFANLQTVENRRGRPAFSCAAADQRQRHPHSIAQII